MINCPSAFLSAASIASLASSQRYFALTRGSHSSGAGAATTDHTTRASVVVKTDENLRQLRDKMAREKLTENLPEQQVLQTVAGVAMTVPYKLKIVSPAETAAEVKAAAEAVIEAVFAEINAALNNYQPASEISRINAAAASDDPFQLSPALAAVMRCVEDVNATTGGSFDPAVAPVRRFLLGLSDPENLTAAEAAALDEMAAFANYRKAWRFDAKTGQLTKLHAKAALDLGGVAKGYAVDCVVERLQGHGCGSFVFDWGGDCRAVGCSPSGSAWAVGVPRPPSCEALAKQSGSAPGSAIDEASLLLRVVALPCEAIATSGDYENLTPALPDGRVFTATVDPLTLRLVRPCNEGVAQVTVRCRSCMYADALATACLVKRDIAKVRYLLEEWRYRRNRVTDYVAYSRESETVAHMHAIAGESEEMRAQRIASTLPARVVVVGGGLAGLSAAIEAASAGAMVVLIEKTSKVGGNSAKATSGINGWGTEPQSDRDIVDSGKFFERDTFLSGKGGDCDTGLVKILSVKSREAIRWLTDFGIPLSVVSQLGGHSKPRTHRAPDKPDGTPMPIGFTIMKQLEAHIRAKLSKSVTIITSAALTDLMHTTERLPTGATRVRVTGVRYREMDPQTGLPLSDSAADELQLTADAVVLATGGFANDHTDASLLAEFAPHLQQTPTTNGEFATGDGVKVARRLGADLVDMDKLQLHPTGFIDPKRPSNKTKFLGPEALRGSGGILLNTKGERFVDELDLRSVVSKAIIAQGDVYPNSGGSAFAHCVLNSAAADLFGRTSLGFYGKKMGLFAEVADVAGLAAHIGCDEAALRVTLEAYGAASAAKTRCPRTSKAVYPCALGPEGPFWVAAVTPSIHYTMGGLRITPGAEVCAAPSGQAVGLVEDRQGRRIEGLFGAGEVTGGVHGNNRLGGNSLLECVVFGRVAGDRAATILQRRHYGLSRTHFSPVILAQVQAGGAFGLRSKVLTFNLPGSLQPAGTKLGEFVEIRGEWDGRPHVGYYSPVSLPTRLGSVAILSRADRGPHREWLNHMGPGCVAEMRIGGGLAIDVCEKTGAFSVDGRPVRRLALLAGGSGVAPMLQIIKACRRIPAREHIASVALVYAAETLEELSHRELLQTAAREDAAMLKVHFVLNDPPAGWTEGVGLIGPDTIDAFLQAPSDDLLVLMCGPVVMQRAVFAMLKDKGYDTAMVKSLDGTENE